MVDFQKVIDEIKNIDPTEIRGDNIGRWPLVVRVLAGIAVFAIAIALCFVLMVSKSNSTLSSAVKKENTLKETFKQRSTEAANLEAYREQMGELRARLNTLINQLPSDTEVPGLLEDITETGQGSGLEIQSIALQQEVSHEYYIELPIQMTATGGYHDFATFVSGVSSLPRIVTLHDFTIDQSNGALTLDIIARTYRYKEPEE